MVKSDPVQRFTPPENSQLLTMHTPSDEQAGVCVRDLYKSQKPKRAEDLDFTVPFQDVASFPDTLGWDISQPIEELPRIWRATRRAERFVLIMLGGAGSCLIAEAVDADAPLGPDAPVRVHPYPLSLPAGRSLSLGGTRFGVKAENQRDIGQIAITADPGTGPAGTHPTSEPKPGPKLDPAQEVAILAALDQEIIAWGDVFAAAHIAKQAGEAKWPSELCRHVLKNKDQAAQISEATRAAAIQAYVEFANDSNSELVVNVCAPKRPSALETQDDRPWSVFLNLRNEIAPEPMKALVEDALREIFAATWPDGWYDIMGPAQSSRLGLESQLRKTTACVTGPFSSHEKIEAASIINSLRRAV
jgi:hypothetical protein